MNEEKDRQFLYSAVIIEPRRHRALGFVLDNVLSNLSEEWQVIVIYGTENGDFLREIIEAFPHTFKRRIVTYQLPVADMDMRMYQDFLLNENYYNLIPTEMFIMFQTDSMICPEGKERISDFLKYDYVGAPWGDPHDLGNAGFSLQRKSKILEKIKTCPYYDPWDIWISRDPGLPLYKPAYERFSAAFMFAREISFLEKTVFMVSRAACNLWYFC